MNKFISVLLLLFVAGLLPAQVKFTERLTKVVQGQGVVTVHQSSTITNLVNGGTLPVQSAAPSKSSTSISKATESHNRATTASARSSSSVKKSTDSICSSTPDTAAARVYGEKIRVNGFRIQVYSGGNSREAKQEAQRVGIRIHNYFEDVAVYTSFNSPHWNCRVGDFTSREEALSLLNQIRETGRFQEAVIVKCKVNVYQ